MIDYGYKDKKRKSPLIKENWETEKHLSYEELPRDDQDSIVCAMRHWEENFITLNGRIPTLSERSQFREAMVDVANEDRSGWAQRGLNKKDKEKESDIRMSRFIIGVALIWSVAILITGQYDNEFVPLAVFLISVGFFAITDTE